MITKAIHSSDLAGMEQRYRAACINSLGGFKSIQLVGSKSKDGQSNLAIFNSIVHLGANPPLIGMIVRPDSVERHTYENILATGFYTLNHIHEEMYVRAHQTSARYPRNESEFIQCGLNEEYKDGFYAPYVQESKVQIGVALRDKIHIPLNKTILVVGEIVSVYLPESALQADGFIDLEKAGTLAGSGLDSYHRTSVLNRLSYAKPGSDPSPLPR